VIILGILFLHGLYDAWYLITSKGKKRRRKMHGMTVLQFSILPFFFLRKIKFSLFYLDEERWYSMVGLKE